MAHLVILGAASAEGTSQIGITHIDKTRCEYEEVHTTKFGKSL